MTGKSIVGLRAEDIIRMVHFIKTNDSGYHSISAVSVNGLGSELLHAAYFDKNIQRISLLQPFLSFAEIAMEHDYHSEFIPSTVAGAIRKYDLPDLMAGMFPRKILIINPLSAKGLFENKEIMQNSLYFPHETYADNNNPGNFVVVSEQNNEEIFNRLLLWLK